jgi:CubicO group peptidase (beta-lactamase class C family)
MKMWASLLTAALSATLTAQPSTPAGFSRERLTRVDRLLDQYVAENRVAGAVALVLRDGEVIYERAVGWSDKENGRKMQSDTIFRIASQSKAVTSVAALMLVEEGKISLDDPVSRFIPTFSKTTVAVQKEGKSEIVAARRPITIRHLLTHTSGISYGTGTAVADSYAAAALGPAAGFGWYTADKSEPICDSMERLATLPFAAQPGEAWVYGYSLDVLGCVIERASGVRLDEFIRTRITDALGMRDTFFYLPREQRARLAAVYTLDADRHITLAPAGARGQGDYVDGPRRSFAGGAGLLSTARDYARFLEMIRADGVLDDVRILSPRTVRLMTTNQVGSLHSATGLGFGLGFETVDRFGASSVACVGTFGWGGAYGSRYLVDPESRLTIVLLEQLLPDPRDLREKFVTMFYQALVERPTDRCLGMTPQ